MVLLVVLSVSIELVGLLLLLLALFMFEIALRVDKVGLTSMWTRLEVFRTCNFKGGDSGTGNLG